MYVVSVHTVESYLVHVNHTRYVQLVLVPGTGRTRAGGR
jgi:hypothetical protein